MQHAIDMIFVAIKIAPHTFPPWLQDFFYKGERRIDRLGICHEVLIWLFLKPLFWRSVLVHVSGAYANVR